MVSLRLLLLLVLLTLTLAAPEKKIELQDIEEDNLKSEKAKALEDVEEVNRENSDDSRIYGELPKGSDRMVEYLGNGLTYVYGAPTAARYVQQYAVTENGNEATVPQAMLLPLRLFYRVPQYAHTAAHKPTVQYVEKSNLQPVSVGPTDEINYVNYPTHVAQSIVSQIPASPQYVTPLRYLLASQLNQPSAPTSGQHPTTYVTSHPTPIFPAPALHTQASVTYEKKYAEKIKNDVFTKPDSTKSNNNPYGEIPQIANKIPTTDYARKYNKFSRQRMPSSISELPRPTPLLYDPQPPHLIGVPKILSIYNQRPLSKPIYSHIAGNLGQYGPDEIPYKPQPVVSKRRPHSLLDSYVPSGLQLEYLRRGLTKDALSTYDAIVNGNAGIKYGLPYIKHFERGFLPNQMYHTGAGGVTYGHYKSTPK